MDNTVVMHATSLGGMQGSGQTLFWKECRVQDESKLFKTHFTV